MYYINTCSLSIYARFIIRIVLLSRISVLMCFHNFFIMDIWICIFTKFTLVISNLDHTNIDIIIYICCILHWAASVAEWISVWTRLTAQSNKSAFEPRWGQWLPAIMVNNYSERVYFSWRWCFLLRRYGHIPVWIKRLLKRDIMHRNLSSFNDDRLDSRVVSVWVRVYVMNHSCS